MGVGVERDVANRGVTGRRGGYEGSGEVSVHYRQPVVLRQDSGGAEGCGALYWAFNYQLTFGYIHVLFQPEAVGLTQADQQLDAWNG